MSTADVMRTLGFAVIYKLIMKVQFFGKLLKSNRARREGP